LQNRVSNPSQTPLIRRTAVVQPYEEPKKSSRVGTILAALVLVGVIVYGGYKLRPELEAARERNNTGTGPAAAVNASQQAAAQAATTQTKEPAATNPQDGLVTAGTVQLQTTDTTRAATDSVPDKPVDANPKPVLPVAVEASGKKPEKAAAEKPAAEKSAQEKKILDGGLTPAAADYKARIAEAVLQEGLGNRVKVAGTGNTLTISGKLRPQEHSSLLHFMRNAPAAVHVVDDILYDDAPVPVAEKVDDGGHPVPTKGLSAIHVVTDVLGATASVLGPAGRAISECQTPCSFNNLLPAHYSLQIQKDGYQSVQTALQLKIGEVQDQKFHLDSLAKGLFISSRPPGAEVFINGALQSGKTPVTLPLAAGAFNLVVRLNGYEAYVGQVQVKDNVQTTMELELKPRAQPHVAWAQVTTTPTGAEIFVDGVSSGKFSPARVQIPAGAHTLVVKLSGFQPAKRTIEATEGGTVTITETMKAKE